MTGFQLMTIYHWRPSPRGTFK